MFNVFIGLGSNLTQPVQQIHCALVALEKLPTTRLIKISSLYRNPALLSPDNSLPQPDYLNAVAWIETALKPENLLQQLQFIEIQQGRQRTEKKWSARPLDLDILLYGDLKIHLPHLIIPHPSLLQRAFVLVPLGECNPDLILPNGEPIQTFISDDMKQQLTRI